MLIFASLLFCWYNTLMTDDNNNSPISSDEYKKVTEKMYGQNLELVKLSDEHKKLTEKMYEQNLEVVRLYKQVEIQAAELEIANEKLKGLDKLKSEFLSLASHQLRSPLTAIRGYASILSEGGFAGASDSAKEMVSRIFESSTNMTKMVEDFLNVSKIEQGGMQYVKENFDFADMVSAVSKDFTVVVEGKGLTLSYTQDNLIHTVFGDKEKLRQVVINFIDNSIKYTEKGSIEVSTTSKNGKVIFAVKDTGRGVSPKEKEELFQKFSRGSGGKVNSGGSGLGLYLAKEIVLAHGGNIGIDSPGEGKGSTFYVELPAGK